MVSKRSNHFSNLTAFKFLLLNFILVSCKSTWANKVNLTFPQDFLLGVATSAYQVEGAWNLDGKGESVWDHYLHHYPEMAADHSDGDLSCDFYHKYKEDIALVKSFGFNHFRFSISWPRIFPNGIATNPNPAGVRFYHQILDELEKHGLIPVVTIYHWDHPYVLEKIGSWTNSRMAYLYADYARFIFQEYGPRVKIFVTINEPQIYCRKAYSETIYAPARNMSDVGKYLCVHNMLKGHALAYRNYEEEFRSEQGGKLGIVMPCQYDFPKDKNDKETERIAFEMNCGWVAHPIFSKEGDYPELMKQRVQKRSELKGLRRSELPTFSKEWIEIIRGSADFFGLNHYTSHIAEPLPESDMINWPDNQGLVYSRNPYWMRAQSSWLDVVPEGFGNMLRAIKDNYNNPEVFIMECGVADAGRNGDPKNDVLRILYLSTYMREMLIAMKRDQCNVKAFTIWSFLDSMEWNDGFTKNFGLVHVDFKSPDLKRSLKRSSPWLKTVLETRTVYPDNSLFVI